MAAHPVQITDTNFIVTNQPHQRLQKKHWSLLVSQAAKTRRKRYEPIPLRPAGRFQWTQSTDDRNLIIENAGQQGEQEQSAGLTLRLSSPTNDNHFGALRKDPFNSFPVQDKSIPQALDNRTCDPPLMHNNSPALPFLNLRAPCLVSLMLLTRCTRLLPDDLSTTGGTSSSRSLCSHHSTVRHAAPRAVRVLSYESAYVLGTDDSTTRHKA